MAKAPKDPLAQFKTPLRYPGGKSRACKKMDPFFPDLRNYNQFVEPFIGGGSVAIYVTKKNPNIKIWVNDLHQPLVNFWQQLQMFGPEMQTKTLELKSRYPDRGSGKGLFQESLEYLNKPIEEQESLWSAISFYIVNKCSFSGLTQSSCYSPQAFDSNFSVNNINKLTTFSNIIKNWKITNYSYDYLLEQSKEDDFFYLDPPYDIKDNLYGKKGSMHKGFNHDKFAEDCSKNSVHMMISYNSDQLVRDRFTDPKWNAAEFDLTYTMRSVGDYMSDQKTRKELLLMNYESGSKVV